LKFFTTLNRQELCTQNDEIPAKLRIFCHYMSDLKNKNPKLWPTCDQILLERKKYFTTYSDIKHDSQNKGICNEFLKFKSTNLAQKILFEKISSELRNDYYKKLSLEVIYVKYNVIENFSKTTTYHRIKFKRRRTQ
jgi:hypothetical protein